MSCGPCFHELDYTKGLTGAPHQRLVALAEALDWVLAKQDEAAQREIDKQAKKAAHRRFQDAVLGLSKAFALCSASDAAREVRDEVGFFQTVRAAMVKAADTTGRSSPDRDLAIRQIVNGAVTSTEIVDILSAAGLSSPDISILSDAFLYDVGQMEKKNLALEALKKLLNDEIRSRSKSNVIETRKFSERLEEAISRYHTNAISTVEVLQDLIVLAKELREARNRGVETGLTSEEIAFYDALADNQSAVDILGNDHLKIIAHELLNALKANVSVDWAHRDSARARLRVLVKRILRKYGYPPDLEDGAVRGVLAQAEALLSRTMWQGEG